MMHRDRTKRAKKTQNSFRGGLENEGNPFRIQINQKFLIELRYEILSNGDLSYHTHTHR